MAGSDSARSSHEEHYECQERSVELRDATVFHAREVRRRGIQTLRLHTISMTNGVDFHN